MVAHCILDEPGGLGRCQAVLGLALELRIADEHAQHDFRTGHHIVCGQVLRFLDSRQIAECAQALDQCGAQALFVRSAIGGGHGVAVPACRSVRIERPGDRPFHAARFLGKVLIAGEGLGGHAFAPAELFGQMVGKTAGKFEHRFGGHIVAREAFGAFPADLNPGEEIGLRPRQLEQPLGTELALAEDLGVGNEADRGAAAIGSGT